MFPIQKWQHESVAFPIPTPLWWLRGLCPRYRLPFSCVLPPRFDSSDMVGESWEPSPQKHGLFISLVSLFMGFKSSLNWNISVETIRHVLQRKGCIRLVHLCCAINGLCHKCTGQSINGLGSLYCAQLWPQGSYGLPNCTLSYFSQPPACCAPVSRFICLMQGIRCCMQGSSWQFFFACAGIQWLIVGFQRTKE